ncbi:MAG: hypothetical protein WBD07_05455 [Vicinamibacterales bacterium]
MARRDASMALGVRADGVSIVAGLLKDRDLFTRQTAIISLDGLAERLTTSGSGIPEPALIGPAVEAIPAIVSAFNDENEVVRCTSARVLNRFLQPVAPDGLRDEAARRIQGVVARCSRPAAARVPTAPPVVTRQEPQAPSPAEVPALVDQLESLNQQVALRAAQTLAAAGPSVVPLLTEQLNQRKGCQFQWSASGVVAMVDRQQGAFVGRILVGIARGECTGSSQLDNAIRRQAALVLVTKEDGVPVVAGLFTDPDLFVRRTAAFAFDELAERLQSGRPDRIASPTPGLVTATIAAIPALVGALESEDEVVRCMSYEALVEFQTSAQLEVRGVARRLGGIRTPRGCSSR